MVKINLTILFVLLTLGLVQLQAQTIENVQNELKDLKQNDENLIVIAELATIYRKKGDFKTAFDLYLTVIKMDKRSPVFKLESAKAIGEMYAKGELGKKDKMRAYMWAKISTTMYSEYNHDSTIKFMDSLSLPIPSKISAKSKADICIDSEYNDC